MHRYADLLAHTYACSCAAPQGGVRDPDWWKHSGGGGVNAIKQRLQCRWAASRSAGDGFHRERIRWLKNRPFSLPTAFFSPLLLLPLPRSLNSSTSTSLPLFLHHTTLYLSCAFRCPPLDFFPPIPPCLFHTFLHEPAVPFGHLQSWMTHVYDPYEGTHLFSAHPLAVCSPPPLWSPRLPLRSTCLHTSAVKPPQTVFCPFNIPSQVKRVTPELQYPLKPSPK